MALSSYLAYLPDKVNDAIGLKQKISEDVRHITWLTIDRVFWPQDVVRLFLIVGYSNGFQVWDVQDPANAREVLSKPDKPVSLARLLPVPLPRSEDDSESLGVASGPMLAYLHRGAPALVRLFSMPAHDDVHLLRLTEPAKALQASRRFFAVGLTRQVELYDACHFHHHASVQCAGLCPTFALGHRWLAYNLPPQQSGTALSTGLSGAVRLGMMREALQSVGQTAQRALDNMLMPPPEGAEQQPTPLQAGIVTVRDAESKAVIAQFNDHSEPIEMMVWDPSGLQLVTCAALGHRVLVHRVLVGADHTLMMQDSVQGDFALGGVVFQHLYTLSRGYTPAIISDITVSDDGRQVAVSSAKGTTHVFRLPPLHSPTLGRRKLTETGAVRLAPSAVPRAAAPGVDAPGGIGFSIAGSGAAPPNPINLNASARVKLGSVILQEGLMPTCGFVSSTLTRQSSRHSRASASRICVATRAGGLAVYGLIPSSPRDAASAASDATEAAGGGSRGSGESGEWQAELLKEQHICRPLQHFTELRLSRTFLSPAPETSRERSRASGKSSKSSTPLASPRHAPLASPRLMVSPRTSGEESAGAEASKWFSQVETATHVPMEVPIWHCPQLSFHTYPTSMNSCDLNESLRSGKPIPGCKYIHVIRPERSSDLVHYDGAERLSVMDALGTAVDDEPFERTSRASGRHVPRERTSSGPRSITVGTAWGSIGDRPVGSLEQAEVEGGLEDVEEDWLKAESIG